MFRKDDLYTLFLVVIIISVLGISLGFISLLVFFVSNLSLMGSLVVATFTHVILFYMLYRKIVGELKEMNVDGLDFDDVEDLS